MTTCLVLGAGGLSGISWEIGLIAALQDGGIDLSSAELLVGTSVGSVVAARFAQGIEPSEFLATQLLSITESQTSGQGC